MRRRTDATVINTNGIETMTHDTIVSSFVHKRFSTNVTMMPMINSIMAR